uniref:NADH-ubiquinone oxidoreductase chain 2 n=1 Tax=Aparapotamon similium TaxID=2654968 RepID=A0A7S6PVG4_9EUCA|nr:NADH dehydrogenase subunit 2 [Aparapotamon similium]QOU10857.1 NADH dehydrogenase subunit 2 [Aparapotamon similium]
MFPASSFFFLSTLLLGIMISISSTSWFNIWVGLELNMMSFIPLITIKMNSYFSESALKYFLIQALGSTLFIVASCLFFSFKSLSSTLILMSLFLKLGSAPFHFWFPQVMSGLTWPQTILLMTVQKIAPMILISYLLNSPTSFQIISLSAMLSALIGALGGLNSTYLRKIMAFSSINHMSWMLISLTISEMFWYAYFLFYSLISISIVTLFNMSQAFTLSDLMKYNQINLIFSLLIPLNLLSLGGLPPFTGFIPKWMLIQLLINNKLYFSLFIFLFSALITLYFYLRITIFFFLLFNSFSIMNMIPFSSFSNFISPLFLFFNLFMFLFPFMFIFL